MQRLGLVTTILITLVLLGTASCDTMNSGVAVVPDRGPVIGDVRVTTPTSFMGCETATITVPWTGGVGPFTIAIEVGTGESVPAGTAADTSPFSWDFMMEEGSTFTWEVVITDSWGRNGRATGTYGPISGGPPPEPPVITNVSYDEETYQLTVTIQDYWYGDDAIVSVTDIEGLSVDSNHVSVPGGNGDAVFQWSAVNPLIGGSGVTTVEAEDGASSWRWRDPETIEITILPIELNLAAGQLAAIPMPNTAAVGETVTILVVSGPFPAEAAFNYMTGVSVTVTDGGDYVDDTFNVGSLGGAIKDVDGIWAEMDPAPNTFFIPENFMMKANDVDADNSLDFMNFNITPIGAGEVTVGGELFNFGMAFDHAGTYELGLLEFQDVKRTYYSGSYGVEYSWQDISNDIDIDTSITVH